ncbi:MAG: low temperature-induced protein [Patescibacteria group bacterium]
MKTTTTIGVFPNKDKAEFVIEDLKTTGVSDTEISCVYTNNNGDIKDSQTGEKVGTGAAVGASTGAVLGTIAGLVVANGLLPGLGTLFVAGPLAAALGLSGAAATTVAAAATGLAAGGIIGGLSQLGVSTEDAKLYEKHIESGEALVICRTDNVDVVNVFNNHNAMEVRQYIND